MNEVKVYSCGSANIKCDNPHDCLDQLGPMDVMSFETPLGTYDVQRWQDDNPTIRLVMCYAPKAKKWLVYRRSK